MMEKTKKANSNLGPEDEELLKPSILTRGKTVRRPPPGFMSGQDSIINNANVNGTSKSLNLYGDIGKGNYAFMGHNIHASDDVNNLGGSNSFTNGSNTASNSLNFINFDGDQKSRSRSGSGNNNIISGHPSPGMLPPANNNTNHLNFQDVDKLASLSSMTAAQDRNMGDNRNSGNDSYGFSSKSFFDSSVSGSNTAFGEGFNGHLGGSSYIQSNNSTFSLDLPNVSSVIPMKSSISNRLNVDDDDDEEILLMASNPSFGNSTFGSFGDPTFGNSSTNTSTESNVRDNNANLGNDVRTQAPPGFGNSNDNKW